MSKTIAVFGAGPGMDRSVGGRFGREGFQVGLVARNQTRLDAHTAELSTDRGGLKELIVRTGESHAGEPGWL